MATGHCWALWQHLPQRYQLSTRDMGEAWDGEAVSRSNDGSPVTPRSRRESPRYPATTPGVVPPQECLGRSGDSQDRCKKSAFPQRKSRYINAMKSQLRVNSARQNMTSDPSKITHVPSLRRRSSQRFPVTRLSNLDRSTEEEFELAACGKNALHPEMSTLSATHPRLAVHNIFPFEDSENTHPIRDRAKKYLVNELQDATMFIDNDKIIYFKNAKPNVTHSSFNGPYSAKHDGESYISHLRRVYLKNAKDVFKKRKESEISNAYLQEVRCDYDRRVCHILDYYSHGGVGREQENARDQSPGTPVSRERSGGRRGRLRSPGPGGARLRSLMSCTSCAQRPNTASGSGQRHRDPLEEWSMYLKFNQMAILHDKQFYLRTPDTGSLFPGSRNGTSFDKGGKCSCRLCCGEMDLSDIAKRNQIVMREQIPLHPKQELHRETESPGIPTPSDSEKQQLNTKSTFTVEQDSHNDSITKRSEHLTITLPGIAEEKELSDLSSTVTKRNPNHEEVVVCTAL